jgi:hypothetical protein
MDVQFLPLRVYPWFSLRVQLWSRFEGSRKVRVNPYSEIFGRGAIGVAQGSRRGWGGVLHLLVRQPPPEVPPAAGYDPYHGPYLVVDDL